MMEMVSVIGHTRDRAMGGDDGHTGDIKGVTWAHSDIRGGLTWVCG